MTKDSAKKVVKKDVKSTAKTDAKATHKPATKHAEVHHSGKTSEKDIEKALEAGLDSQVEYAYEGDGLSNLPKPKKVGKGHLVAVDYVGKLKNGEEFDNSKNHGPIQFVVGNGQVIPGFDKAVIGMKIGDTKKFNIPKAEAYGDVNPELIQEVPSDKIPEHIRSQLKVGGFLVMQSPTGQQVPVKIVKMSDTTVSLDMNHPLAGQDLHFEITVVDVNNAPANIGCGCDDCGDDCGGDCGPECDCGHDHEHHH